MNKKSFSMCALANALGNKIRWQALRELAAGVPLMTIELADRVGVTPNTLSRHMQVLMHCGLVKQNRARQYFVPSEWLASKKDRVLDYGGCLLRLGGLE